MHLLKNFTVTILGYCEQCCRERGSMGFCQGSCSRCLWMCSEMELLAHVVVSLWNFYSVFHSAVPVFSRCSMLSLLSCFTRMFALFGLFANIHLSRREVSSYWGLVSSLWLEMAEQVDTFSHTLTSVNICFFLAQILSSYFNWITCSSFLSYVIIYFVY